MRLDYALTERALGFDVNPGGTQLFAVQVTFLGLAWISILFRGYVRLHMIKQVSLDDYLMFASVLIYTGYSIIAIWGIFGGTGMHTSQLTAPQAAQALEAWFLCEVIYAPLSALVRTSIALFLLRIATQKIHRAIIYTTIVIIWILSIVYFFLMMFQCSPPSHFWEQVYRKPGTCMDPNVVPAATIAHSVISAVCDFTLALLPIAMMWDVQLNKRTKATVAALLSMGLIAGIALIVRIPYIKFLAISTDFLSETIDVAIWSVMEPSLGIVAGCVATLRPLFKAWGFGPSSASPIRKYVSKPRSNGSNAVWRQSRGMQKLSSEPTTTSSQVRSGKVSDSSSSDIELIRSVKDGQKTTQTEFDSSFESWEVDIEQGDRAEPDGFVPSSAVRVQTSINVTTHPRQEPTSSDDSGPAPRPPPPRSGRTTSALGREVGMRS